jgi:O-antigen ligase
VEADVERHTEASIPFVRSLIATPTTATARLLALSMLILPIAFIEPVLIPAWTPRTAVALLVAPIGLTLLAADLRQRDRPALWFTGFMFACTVGTLVADVPLWNIRGGFGRDSSLTFLLLLAAFWATGRSLDSPGRRLVAAASITGAAMSCLVAVAQVVVAPSNGATLALFAGRPSGLFGNPVYLGAVAAGVCTLAAVAWSRGSCPTGIGIASVTLFAACVSLSGSRGAAVGVVVGVVAAIVGADNRTRLLLASSTVAGWIGAQLLSNLNDGRDVAARVTLEDAGRSTVWKYAAEAIADRPVLGHGFGQFRAAIQGHFEPDFVREHARNPFQDAWPDAHNVVFQFGVIGGLAALAFMAAFGYSAARRARGPAAWAAVAVMLTWMLQPVTLATGSMAFVWLGLAMAPTVSARPGPSDRTVHLLVALGAIMAVSLLLVDQSIYRLLDQPEELTARVDDLPSDPVLATLAADRQSLIGDLDDAEFWARRRAELEPFSAVASASLAALLLDAGDWVGAEHEIRRSLDEDPYNPEALRTAFGIALVTENDALFDLVTARLEELGLD